MSTAKHWKFPIHIFFMFKSRRFKFVIVLYELSPFAYIVNTFSDEASNDKVC